MEADYQMKEGETLRIGVGDLSIEGSRGGLEDIIDVTLRGGELEIAQIDSVDNPADESNPFGSQTFAENGSTMTIELLPKGGKAGQTLRIEKTCPPPAN